MTGVEFLLFIILYTPRSASHNHDINVTRFATKEECMEIGNEIVDKRDSWICIPVASIHSSNKIK